jgi:hypothetical protein
MKKTCMVYLFQFSFHRYMNQVNTIWSASLLSRCSLFCGCFYIKHLTISFQMLNSALASATRCGLNQTECARLLFLPFLEFLRDYCLVVLFLVLFYYYYCFYYNYYYYYYFQRKNILSSAQLI